VSAERGVGGKDRAPAEDRWARVGERGTASALRFGGWVHRRLGPRTSLLWLPSLYYLVASGVARRGSRQYQERLWQRPEGRRALGRRPGPVTTLRHLHEFAVALYDRMAVWSGELDSMDVEHDGSERIFGLARSGRGALLLGAHIGSLDMLWFLSRKYDLTVNVVVFYQNAQRINAFLESLAPEARLRAIDLDPQSVRAAFEIKACLDRGELVVMMADRMAPGKTARAAEAPFLGAPARFPLGPFLLASVLSCPVWFALCVRLGTGRYRTVLRPVGEAGRVPRRERERRAGELLATYVGLVEEHCLRFPLQWFNFYEFWGEEGGRV